MRYSQFYAPTKKNVAKTDSINAYLLVKAGYITQVAAGAYALLPLGLRSIKKIEQIVREEMDAIGGNETSFTALLPKQEWQKSGRWDDEDFRSILYQDTDTGMTLAPTHEEPMTQAVSEAIQSYRDLPVLLYQFQTKFRKELRAKSGLLRGREFRMKDLYSFHADEQSHNEFFEEVAKAYFKILERMSLEAYRIKADSGVFSKESSDEFQVACVTGEDEILINRESKIGYSKEIEDKIPQAERGELERIKTIEVGHIFHLGSKYTDAFGVNYSDKDGQVKKVIMGCYGIGITRLLGTLAEIYNDECGLILPKAVAPFEIQLIDFTNSEKGAEIYAQLTDKGFEVLFDDRDLTAGQKMADADLIGAPIRIIYSQKTATEESIELKYRSRKDVELVKLTDLNSKLAG